MAINGAVGVGNAIERAKSQDIPKRMVACPNGHGLIGQVFTSVKYWAGECKTCGASPQE